MDDSPDSAARHRELVAAVLFGASSIMLAIAIGAMLLAGWSGGRLDNRIEPLFWAGGILTAAGVACFGVAAVDGRRGATWLVRIGMALVITGPVLCVTAVFGDYWI